MFDQHPTKLLTPFEITKDILHLNKPKNDLGIDLSNDSGINSSDDLGINLSDDSGADSDTLYSHKTAKESSSQTIGDHAWHNLNNKVHVILVRNPEKERHQNAICILAERMFQVVVLGVSIDDLSWLPSNCEFWEA